jgi:hypothetical protein
MPISTIHTRFPGQDCVNECKFRLRLDYGSSAQCEYIDNGRHKYACVCSTEQNLSCRDVGYSPQ